MEVKTRRRGRPRNDENRLEREKIIQTAKQLTMDAGKVPSIRGLAAELGVDPMAIYYYFSNKKDLLEAVSITLISELHIPDDALSWKENLLILSNSYLSLLLSYPGLIQVMLSSSSQQASAIFIERFEHIISPLVLTEKTRKAVVDLLVDYIHGFATASSCNEEPIPLSFAEGPLNFIIESMERY